jgi:hypothetical protein
MTQTFIGVDSVGVPCIKITKGTIDPSSEPDANVGSFYFNSKWSKDIKIQKVITLPQATGTAYMPAGSNQGNYQWASYTDFGTYYQVFRASYFGADYTFPAYDVKVKRRADGRFIEQTRTRFQSGEDAAGREAAFYRTRIWGLWYENLPGYGTFGTTYYNFFGGIGAAFVPTVGAANDPYVILWSLPGNNVPIHDSTPQVPVPGQRVVEITDDFCRVAKPGFDTRTATPFQMAFDSSRRPVKIIKGDDIALPLGVSSYNLGFPVTENTVCDMILYTGSVITFPMSQYNEQLVTEYWFSGTSIFFNNTAAACRVRFIVMAFDSSPPTTGANKVLRQFVEGGQNVVQFMKPGAADPPNFADIVLDSRWPSLQILAEGSQPIAGQPNRVPPGSVNTGQSFTVNFDSAGMFPFVKYWTRNFHSRDGWTIKPALTFITENYNNSTRYHQGNSSYCVLTANQATFWTFNGNPAIEYSTGGTSWGFDYPADPISEIRYFILGIPTP